MQVPHKRSRVHKDHCSPDIPGYIVQQESAILHRQDRYLYWARVAIISKKLCPKKKTEQDAQSTNLYHISSVKRQNQRTRAQSCCIIALLFSGHKFISCPTLHCATYTCQIFSLCARPFSLAFFFCTAQALQCTRVEGTESQLLPPGPDSWEPNSKTILPLMGHTLHMVKM